MSKRKRFVATILVALMAICLCAGFASAADTASTDPAQYHAFDFDLEPGGVTTTGTAQSKISTASYAYFNVTEIENASTYPLYLNVRNSSGGTIVGTAVSVSGTGVKNVYYKSGYGTVGVKYRPSAQTNSSAKVSCEIEGQWRP